MLKFLFFTLLKKLDLIDTSLPWFSPIEPKPVYKNQRAKAYCDVLFFFFWKSLDLEQTEILTKLRRRKMEDKRGVARKWKRKAEKSEKTVIFATLRLEHGMQFAGDPEYHHCPCIGGPALLCVYCSSCSWKIKCHS